MAHIVTDKCINCVYTDCVNVCPVDCFLEGPNMLVIDPDRCIDCGVCVLECPAQAIEKDSASEDWALFNRTYAALWPSITRSRPHRKDADSWKGVEGKIAYLEGKKS